ncbi:hypothetical protein [Lentibacillus sp. JNUCC-1]|uniref:hypothetical protein n=1 Tax=Lentibacillus sp. JNUCC-1 TaxID=2654513 RepID=UPI0012E7675B|nr:hypothetical protein [Lentibacillus sp. JNUCC-1]
MVIRCHIQREANAQTDSHVQNGDDVLTAPNISPALVLEGMAITTANGEEVSEVTVPAGSS